MEDQECSDRCGSQSRNNKREGEMETADDKDDGSDKQPTKNERNPPRRRKSDENVKAKGKKRSWRLSQNPFIIFYLRIFSKSPGKRVTVVAREAAKRWCTLPEQEKQKYISLARKERIRRMKRK